MDFQGDLMALIIGGSALMVFFVVHFACFRFLRLEQLIDGIQINFLAGLLAAIGLSCLLGHEQATAERLTSAALGIICYGLGAFCYVLCFWGPYETSIRMRLIRELAAQPGASLEEILHRYNTSVILDNRLRRLLGSGHLVQKDGTFIVRKKQNMFFVLDFVAQKMHAFIHSS